MVGTPSVEDAQRFRKSRDVQLSGVAAHVVVSDRISEGGQKSRPLSPHHRFVIAMHSPDGVLESGLLGCLPEKKVAKACLQDWAGHFLRSALRERFAQLRPIRAIFTRIAGCFLCTSDSMAERKEFEPSVQL
jgi:hypothetical protein